MSINKQRQFAVMKREIKFKFWLGHTKKMTYAHALQDVSKIIPEFSDDIIPLQFMGRIDRNGVEIYEGDIIKHGESIRFIEQRDSRILAIRPCKTEAILLCFSEKPEVIGNIYENPELLK